MGLFIIAWQFNTKSPKHAGIDETFSGFRSSEENLTRRLASQIWLVQCETSVEFLYGLALRHLEPQDFLLVTPATEDTLARGMPEFPW